jgi:hypothetical protein
MKLAITIDSITEIKHLSEDLPSWVSGTFLFKYQEASFFRSLWLTYRLITIPDAEGFEELPPTIRPMAHSIGGGIEYLRRVSQTNLAISISAEATSFQAAISVKGTLGVWYFFPGGR